MEKLRNVAIIAHVDHGKTTLVDELLKQYDKKFVMELLNDNNTKPEISIRANILKTSRDDLFHLLRLKNVDCKKGTLPDSMKVKKLPDFGAQLYTVQDEAAQLVCLKLEPQAGDKVLDACSAPGGKTTYIASLMKNNGRVDAWDIHPHRVKMVEEASKKLGITMIKTDVKDASEYVPLLNSHYDKVLLDVPCTGIGVIRKKPDIKWQRTAEDIFEMVKIQEKILNTCSEYFEEELKLSCEKYTGDSDGCQYLYGECLPKKDVCLEATSESECQSKTPYNKII